MKSFFPKLPLGVLLMCVLVIGALPAIAQKEHDDCSTHYANQMAVQMISKAVDAANGVQKNDELGKLRVCVYYDTEALTAYGVTAAEWENKIYHNIIARLDTLLYNTCVYTAYNSNIEFVILPIPTSILMPQDIDQIYNNAAISVEGVLKLLWEGNFNSSGRPHIVAFVSGSSTTGARGTATIMDSYHCLSGMVGIVAIKGQQVHIQTYTGVHECAHAIGGAHPNDSMIDEPGRKGYGTTTTGAKSVLQSPTTAATILEEGTLDPECSSLNNGSSDLTYWFHTIIDSYLEGSPDFQLQLNVQNTVTMKVDSTLRIEPSSNWPEVSYAYYLNDTEIHEGPFFEFTAQEPEDLIITVVATTSSGKTIEHTISVTVEQTTTGTINTNLTQFRILPNPASEYIIIEGFNIYTVHVFDMVGNLLLSSHTNKLDIANLPAGYYILSMQDNNGNCGSSRFSKI